VVLLTRGLRERWDRIPPAWRRALVTATVLRAGLAVVALVGGGLLPGLDPVAVAAVPGTGFRGWIGATPAQQGLGLLGAGLERFDALWYLAIAADGYPTGADGVPQAAAFFPGYPLAVGLVGRALAGAYLLAANLVSFAATVAGLAGIERLAGTVGLDAEARRRAVVLAAVFPTSFFLLAPYSESLFLAVSTWALVAGRERRWGLAGATALAAGFTRNVGVLLVVPLAVDAWRAHRDGDGTATRALPALLGGPAGAALHLAAGWWWWDEPLAPVRVQGGWQRELTWPWETLTEAVRFGVSSLGSYPTGYHSLDLLVVLPVVVAVAWLLVRGPASLAAYALAHAVVWLVLPFPARPLMSVPRFAVVVAPLFLAFAAWTRPPALRTGWVAASAALLGVHALLFTTWYYVF
jgi:hypothetical protein